MERNHDRGFAIAFALIVVSALTLEAAPITFAHYFQSRFQNSGSPMQSLELASTPDAVASSMGSSTDSTLHARETQRAIARCFREALRIPSTEWSRNDLTILHACVLRGVSGPPSTSSSARSSLSSSSITHPSSFTSSSYSTINSALAAMSQTVMIRNDAFSPAELTIPRGTTVHWINRDAAPHTVTGDAGGPSSPLLASGATYDFAFQTVGTYSYHCTVHPSMRGIVRVTE